MVRQDDFGFIGGAGLVGPLVAWLVGSLGFHRKDLEDAREPPWPSSFHEEDARRSVETLWARWTWQVQMEVQCPVSMFSQVWVEILVEV